MSEELIRGDLTGELSRTYSVNDMEGRLVHETTIVNPTCVFYGHRHTFHRIANAEDVVLCYAPGLIVKDGVIVGYCELSWVPRNPEKSCQW